MSLPPHYQHNLQPIFQLQFFNEMYRKGNSTRIVSHKYLNQCLTYSQFLMSEFFWYISQKHLKVSGIFLFASVLAMNLGRP